MNYLKDIMSAFNGRHSILKLKVTKKSTSNKRRNHSTNSTKHYFMEHKPAHQTNNKSKIDNVMESEQNNKLRKIKDVNKLVQLPDDTKYVSLGLEPGTRNSFINLFDNTEPDTCDQSNKIIPTKDMQIKC